MIYFIVLLFGGGREVRKRNKNKRKRERKEEEKKKKNEKQQTFSNILGTPFVATEIRRFSYETAFAV